MRVGSLFSGIGGMEYGLERSGLSTSCEWMIEMDEYCCSVLEKNFPNTLVLNNKVEDINPLDLPKIDILTAGFPCQPVSVAGSRKGVTDERWLWDEVWRFIDVLRPRYFILENVPGIFTANKGKAFERVIKDIAESRSYRFEWQVISARTVGAAHLRKRFFGVGTLGNTEHNGSSQSENRESIGERTISWRQGEEVQEKINRESKGESQDNPILNTEIKSSNETNQQTSSISKSREARLNIGAGYGREESRVDRETAELWMGSTAYGFPRWMARLGLVNVWTGNINNWRTPTTADKKEDALKHATKLLQGKDTRASGESVQITLADQVAMDDINNNPELFDKYKDHIMMKRPNLPEQKIFVDYLRSVTSIRELSEGTDIKKTTIEHWFRYDTSGFSYPNIEDWEKIKPFLSEVKYDKEMITLESFEWKSNKHKFGTPLTSSERPSIKRIIEGNNPKKQLSEDPKVYFDEDYDMWEIGMPRSMEDYPDRKARLTALGNAVVPQCVELVGRLIKRADELGTMVFDVEIEESI
tara:strand:+ start:373 stop:1962 length:1590 start_codon:yes stop_codon:yes gene_type:complete